MITTVEPMPEDLKVAGRGVRSFTVSRIKNTDSIAVMIWLDDDRSRIRRAFSKKHPCIVLYAVCSRDANDDYVTARAMGAIGRCSRDPNAADKIEYHSM